MGQAVKLILFNNKIKLELTICWSNFMMTGITVLKLSSEKYAHIQMPICPLHSEAFASLGQRCLQTIAQKRMVRIVIILEVCARQTGNTAPRAAASGG